MRAHFILYVADQAASTRFYREVLGVAPRLDVPGMTEIEVGDAVLGLMPAAGIARLLGEALPDPRPHVEGAPARPAHARAELYLLVDDPGLHHARALAAGARELAPVAPRDWGHLAGYVLDPDGYVIAFARAVSGAP
jgi:catechol 2,3-dioxygenase-like lactoylglutathione lyase family enzyme